MNSEVLGAARCVPIEMVNMYPSVLDRAIQDVTRNIIDRVVCELEKGESVCSLSAPKQIQKDDLHSFEIRRTVKIERLVRCKDCTHFTQNGWCNREFDWFPVDDMDFCSSAEKMEVQDG